MCTRVNRDAYKYKALKSTRLFSFAFEKDHYTNCSASLCSIATMILPFTTNQWNAIRFVVLNLISIPLIELALHKLHQLGVADRMLRGRKARVRPSFLANWGLHQEVDELSMRSRITAIIVAFCYVGFSLYTEYASGSVPKKSEWKPPVMERSLLNDKPALFDTTLMSVGAFRGCRSKKSREKLLQLLERTVNLKVRRHRNVNISKTKLNRTKDGTFPDFPDFAGARLGGVAIKTNLSPGNAHPIVFSFLKHGFDHGVVAEMHDKEVCFRQAFHNQFVCFSNSENITLRMILGNILLFDGRLPKFALNRGYITLPSASAFDLGCEPKEDIAKRNCDALALARTPSEYFNAVRKVRRSARNRIGFETNFKYDFGPANYICDEIPRIEPPSLKVPEKAKLSVFYGRGNQNLRQSTRYWPSDKQKIAHAQISRSFGVFHHKLIYFEEFKFPLLHCTCEYQDTPPLHLCTERHANGAISLSRVFLGNSLLVRKWWNGSAEQVNAPMYWTLNWTGQDLQLADLSRSALAYLIAERELVGKPSLSPHSISDVLKRGIPKLTQVGSPGVRYDVIFGDTDESATVYAWVLGVWGVVLVIAVSCLVYVKLSKARLLPDVYFLYCHSVMRRHTRYNNGKPIRTVPTAAMASAKGIVKLDISYGDLSAGDIRVNDMLQ